MAVEKRCQRGERSRCQRVRLWVIPSQANAVKKKEKDTAHGGQCPVAGSRWSVDIGWSLVVAFDNLDQPRFQNIQSRIDLLVGQPQPCRRRARAFALVLIRQLAQIEQFLVVAEVDVTQLRAAVETLAI